MNQLKTSFTIWRIPVVLLVCTLMGSCGNTQGQTSGKAADQSDFITAAEARQATDVPLRQLQFLKADNVVMATYQGSRFTGRAVSYHPSGSLHTAQEYQNGIKQGSWSTWYTNGNPHMRGSMVMEQEDGIYHEWYESGQLKYEYFWQVGSRLGTWKSWYENGQQWTARTFENDELNGKVLVWDEAGTLTKEYTYQKGQLTDKQFYFDTE